MPLLNTCSPDGSPNSPSPAQKFFFGESPGKYPFEKFCESNFAMKNKIKTLTLSFSNHCPYYLFNFNFPVCELIHLNLHKMAQQSAYVHEQMRLRFLTFKRRNPQCQAVIFFVESEESYEL